MGYPTAALKGGYHAWRERYPVEPKSPPVVLNPDPEDDRVMTEGDLSRLKNTPAMEHLLAAKHLLSHRPSAHFEDNKSPVDGKVSPEWDAAVTQQEISADQAPHEHANGAASDTGDKNDL